MVNLDARTVEVDKKSVHLTGKEYGILELLSLRKGTTLTKEMFLNHLYGGMDEPELKIIDVFVCKLRKKLSAATGGDNYIETVWGRGYVLRDPPEQEIETPEPAAASHRVRGRSRLRPGCRTRQQSPSAGGKRSPPAWAGSTVRQGRVTAEGDAPFRVIRDRQRTRKPRRDKLGEEGVNPSVPTTRPRAPRPTWPHGRPRQAAHRWHWP